jgi:hypothetical protein
MRVLAIIALLLASPAIAGSARISFAGGNWAAIDFGNRCEARSKALWAKSGTEPYVGFAFDRSGARHGQFYVRLGRPARAGAAVMATIGSAPFLLGSNGQWAWSRNGDQQAAIINAVRYGTGMRIEYRESAGRRSVERYGLRGAATAIDSAAATCAGKNVGA